jgi:hypothetical protein
MKYRSEIELYRHISSDMFTGEAFGAFQVPFKGQDLRVIASDGEGWDHVSVSLPNRCPTWEEMCRIKDLFFDEDETVVQFHPKKSEYVNCHPYCLHLWRSQDQEAVLPPSILVGPKTTKPLPLSV